MNQKHIGALDGLRGLAALLVVLTHAASRNLLNAYDTGSLGVAIFFSLSGFLMGYLYLGKEFTANAAIKYSVSRFARIAPAYLFVIIVSYLIFSYVTADFIYAINNQNFLRHLLFSGSVSVFWSIPPEVQFYVFFLVIWFAVNIWITQKKSNLLWFVITACILMMIFRTKFPGISFPSKIHLFIFGCLAGAVRNHIPLRPPNSLLELFQPIIFIFTLGLGVYLGESGVSPFDGIYYAVLVACMVYTISFRSVFSDFVFANRPLSLVGKWSFSLYLTHQVVLQLVDYLYKDQVLSREVAGILAIVGSICLSWIMFELIERPSQNFIRDRLTPDSLKSKPEPKTL